MAPWQPSNRLARIRPTLFKISYEPTYTSFLPAYIAISSMHPLKITQRRLLKQRKEEGLWWHTTAGTDTSKWSCVRHWASRRLRAAFVEELRQRGYDESGKLVDVGKIKDAYVRRVIKSGRSVDMRGSLRMHGVPLLVPAKFESVKEEVRGIVDALVQTAVDAALEMKFEDGENEGGKNVGNKNERSRSVSSERRQQAQRPTSPKFTDVPIRGHNTKKTVASGKQSPRVKPTASSALACRFREKTATAAAPRIKPRAPAQAAPRSRKSSTISLGQDHCV